MDQSTRKAWVSLLARAPSDLLKTLWEGTGLAPDHTTLRAPEVGGVMLRGGRMGGTGAPFNLGEMTVTRCSLKLAQGAVGGMLMCRDATRIRRGSPL